MDLITDFTHEFIDPNLRYICISMMATFLFLYGNDINKWVTRHIKVQAFILRVLLFVVICSFGFAAITLLGARLLVFLFEQFSPQTIPLAIFLCFFGIGVLAERKNHM